MANKKGSDGRYRYRVCIGKDETGKPNTKAFMVPPQRQRMLLPKLTAQHWAREWIPPNPKPPLLLCTIT